jgi:tolkin
MTACGGTLKATTQVQHLYSHTKFGDHNYDNTVDCDWNIQAPSGFVLHLQFITFELEDEVDCLYDSVQVFAGADEDAGHQFERFCGPHVSIKLIFLNSNLIKIWNFRNQETFIRTARSCCFGSGLTTRL